MCRRLSSISIILIASSPTGRVAKPHYIDVDFRCDPHDPTLFGRRGYAVLFFANYMNDVEDVALHFRGIEAEGGREKWITGAAPRGHADWNQGGTYRSTSASALGYDADHNFKLNSWSYDWPRFTKPFYYGRAAKGMAWSSGDMVRGGERGPWYGPATGPGLNAGAENAVTWRGGLSSFW